MKRKLIKKAIKNTFGKGVIIHDDILVRVGRKLYGFNDLSEFYRFESDLVIRQDEELALEKKINDNFELELCQKNEDKKDFKYRTTTLEEIGLSDEQLAKINPVHPAMDKLNQLIEKYEIQKDFANELIGFDVALKLITKILNDLKELKEQLK